MPHRKPPVSKAKAQKILRDGQIGGRKLSTRQRGLFGSIVSSTFGHPKRRRK